MTGPDTRNPGPNGDADDAQPDAAFEPTLPAAAGTLPHTSAPSLGRLGDFVVSHEIGRGGMGVVYEARQESMRRKVALKVLDPGWFTSQDQVRRFEREGWIAGRLAHPNIVKVYGQGVEGTSRYIAMELIEGPSLASCIQALRDRTGDPVSPSRPRVPPEHVLNMVELFIGVADALATVHAQGIVHRDIKPLNLLLTVDGRRMVLTDFGLARDREQSRLTRRGDFLGTVRYMSPEQLLGHRAGIDHRSDIWSLGVSLYEAVTLDLPFSAESEEGYVGAVGTKEPLPPRTRNRALPADLETVLMKCLVRDPEGRYRSAAELRDDLQRVLDGRPVLARRSSVFTRSARWARRNRAALGAAALGLALSAGAFVAYELRSARPSAAAADVRRRERVLALLAEAAVSGKDPRKSPDWPEDARWLTSRIDSGDDREIVLALARSAVTFRPELRLYYLRSRAAGIEDESVWPYFTPHAGLREGGRTLVVFAGVEGSVDDGPWLPAVQLLAQVGTKATRLGVLRWEERGTEGSLSWAVGPGPRKIRYRTKLSYYDGDPIQETGMEDAPEIVGRLAAAEEVGNGPFAQVLVGWSGSNRTPFLKETRESPEPLETMLVDDLPPGVPRGVDVKTPGFERADPFPVVRAEIGLCPLAPGARGRYRFPGPSSTVLEGTSRARCFSTLSFHGNFDEAQAPPLAGELELRCAGTGALLWRGAFAWDGTRKRYHWETGLTRGVWASLVDLPEPALGSVRVDFNYFPRKRTQAPFDVAQFGPRPDLFDCASACLSGVKPGESIPITLTLRPSHDIAVRADCASYWNQTVVREIPLKVVPLPVEVEAIPPQRPLTGPGIAVLSGRGVPR